MEKIKVLDEVNINIEIFLTSLDKLPKIIKEQKERLENEGWDDLRLVYEDCNTGYDELLLKGMRLETDEEFDKRKKQHEKQLLAAKKKLERERKKYEELKKKFENE